jgi:sec-independent protein translocase protein TatA
MGNLGPAEILIVLVIALILLGPKKLPEVGRSVGKGLREFKEALNSEHDDDESEADHVGLPGSE